MHSDSAPGARPWWLGWPFVYGLALALRGGLFWAGAWRPGAFLAPDSFDYLRLAKGLWRLGVFGRFEAELFRVPGYPLFLSGFAWLNELAVPAAVAVQAVLDVGLVWVAGRLAREWGGGGAVAERAARWGALWQAASVAAAAGACVVLSDSLFALGLAGLLLGMVRATRPPPYTTRPAADPSWEPPFEERRFPNPPSNLFVPSAEGRFSHKQSSL
ncbi:MAG: hypothetical protein WC708_21225, partial [Lentisphaeria bacterium]